MEIRNKNHSFGQGSSNRTLIIEDFNELKKEISSMPKRKKKSIQIQRGEQLEKLSRSKYGITNKKIQKKLGVNRQKATRVIKKMLESGAWFQSKNSPDPDKNGRLSCIPTYFAKEAKNV